MQSGFCSDLILYKIAQRSYGLVCCPWATMPKTEENCQSTTTLLKVVQDTKHLMENNGKKALSAQRQKLIAMLSG
jgi:hypothetical protein